MHSHFPTFSSHTAVFSTPFKSYREERLQLCLVDHCLLLKIKRKKMQVRLSPDAEVVEPTFMTQKMHRILPSFWFFASFQFLYNTLEQSFPKLRVPQHKANNSESHSEKVIHFSFTPLMTSRRKPQFRATLQCLYNTY